MGNHPYALATAFYPLRCATIKMKFKVDLEIILTCHNSFTMLIWLNHSFDSPLQATYPQRRSKNNNDDDPNPLRYHRATRAHIARAVTMRVDFGKPLAPALPTDLNNVFDVREWDAIALHYNSIVLTQFRKVVAVIICGLPIPLLCFIFVVGPRRRQIVLKNQPSCTCP